MNSVGNYDLPVIEDNIISVSHSVVLPSFIKFSYRTYTYGPKKKTELGLYIINGVVKNQYGPRNF